MVLAIPFFKKETDFVETDVETDIVGSLCRSFVDGKVAFRW